MVSTSFSAVSLILRYSARPSISAFLVISAPSDLDLASNSSASALLRFKTDEAIFLMTDMATRKPMMAPTMTPTPAKMKFISYPSQQAAGRWAGDSLIWWNRAEAHHAPRPLIKGGKEPPRG